MAKNQNNAKSRAELAKETAALLRAAQEAKSQKGRIIFGAVIGVIVVALVAVIAVLILNNPKDPNKIKNDAAKLDQPNNLNDDYSFTVSKNGGGKGKDIAGVPTLDIYNDFICPACGSFERQYGSTIDELIDSGEVNVHFHPLAWFNNTSPVSGPGATKYTEPFGNGYSDMYSTRTAAAAYYIMQNVPNKYFDFVRSMYKVGNQPCEGFEGKGGGCESQSPADRGYVPSDGTNEKIISFIVQAGISQDIATKAVESGKYREFAEKAASLVSAKGEVTATPYIALNGVKWCSGQQDKDSYLAKKPGSKTVQGFWGQLQLDEFKKFIEDYK